MIHWNAVQGPTFGCKFSNKKSERSGVAQMQIECDRIRDRVITINAIKTGFKIRTSIKE